MKKHILISIIIAFSYYFGFSQVLSITEYESKADTILYLGLKNNISYSEKISNSITVSVPIFDFSSNINNYSCGEDLFNYIDFKNNLLLQRLVLFKRNKIVGSLFPTGNENDYVEYTFEDFTFDKQTYQKVLKKNFANIFEILGIRGLWTVENNKVYKIEKSCLGIIKKIPSNEYIGKNYGTDYIKAVAENQIIVGKKYKTCKN